MSETLIKLKIYLKSGSELVVRCREYKFIYSKETLEYDGYNIKGSKKNFGLVPSQIAAWEEI